MNVSRSQPLGNPKSASRQEVPGVGSHATRSARRNPVGVNPWVAICVLAIAGWSIDSVLVSVELHRLDGGDFRAHLTHFWYGPPVLLALLLLARRILPKAALSVPHLTAGSIARYGRRSGVKRLADRLATRPGEGAVLGVLLSYPSTAMTAHDLAGHATVSQSDAERALANLAGLDLVEEMQLVGTRFYRLTREARVCDELSELQKWHREWQSQADRLFKIPAPDSGHGATEQRRDGSGARGQEEVSI